MYHILIVEDDPDIRDLLELSFTQTGYLTTTAADGKEALEKVKAGSYDLAVLDILWFCHDPHFVIKGTEDMVKDYHDYRFHARGFLIGEALALVVCVLAGLTVRFVLP